MAADLSITEVDTPIGRLAIVTSPDGVIATAPDPGVLAERLGERPRTRRHAGVEREVRAYFARRLRRFTIPPDLRLVGGSFAADVLRRTCEVPYGELVTYGDVAAAAGRPRAARAAGTALRRSPIELFVPCHRVVPAGPGYGRYGGDEDRRAFLLRLEGAI
jgi:methylated-DNA-[protein]-cysteine S-methyltransferase